MSFNPFGGGGRAVIGGTVVLNPATRDTLGGVIVGEGLDVDTRGKLKIIDGYISEDTQIKEGIKKVIADSSQELVKEFPIATEDTAGFVKPSSESFVVDKETGVMEINTITNEFLENLVDGSENEPEPDGN